MAGMWHVGSTHCADSMPKMHSLQCALHAKCFKAASRALPRATRPWHNAMGQLHGSHMMQRPLPQLRRGSMLCAAPQQSESSSKSPQAARNLLSSPYDAEIWSLLFPALLAVCLDPAMMVIDTGESNSDAHIDPAQASQHLNIPAHPFCAAAVWLCKDPCVVLCQMWCWLTACPAAACLACAHSVDNVIAACTASHLSLLLLPT